MPSASSDIYAGTAWIREGSEGGVFRRSVDGGDWVSVTKGLPAWSILVNPANPRRMSIGGAQAKATMIALAPHPRDASQVDCVSWVGLPTTRRLIKSKRM